MRGFLFPIENFDQDPVGQTDNGQCLTESLFHTALIRTVRVGHSHPALADGHSVVRVNSYHQVFIEGILTPELIVFVDKHCFLRVTLP